jgi:Holliday junction resolvase
VTNYDKGRRFEWAIIEHLEREGYDCIRAAGSKGKCDVLAFKPGQTLVIQAKSGKAWPPPSERAEVIRLAAAIDGIPIIAYKQPGKAQPMYDWLTGVGPKDRIRFLTDEVAA